MEFIGMFGGVIVGFVMGLMSANRENARGLADVASSRNFVVHAPGNWRLARPCVEAIQAEWGRNADTGLVASIRLLESPEEATDIWTVRSLNGTRRIWICGTRERLVEMAVDAVHGMKP